MLIDQLLFGYDEGHRLLAGSLSVERETSSVLLAATDAGVSHSDEHLLTGLPLPSIRTYALSATWLAPEVDRPGAVWAHTLLIGFDDLAVLAEPASLLNYLRHPFLENEASYRERLEVDPHGRRAVSANPTLLRQLVAVATDISRPPLVMWPQLDKAADALVVIWGAGWPDFRNSFAFRTRETLRMVPGVPYLGVARRMKGMGPSTANRDLQPFESKWALRLAIDGPERRSLVRFLHEFGPEQSPEVRTMAALGRMHDVVMRNDIGAVIAELQREQPGIRDAPHLKGTLFGPEAAAWWPVTEVDLVNQILRTRRNMFDVHALDLVPRLRQLIRTGHLPDLVDSLSSSAPRSVQTAVLEALVEELDVEGYFIVAEKSTRLARDVLEQRVDLLSQANFWQRLPREEVDHLLETAPLTLDVVAAVIRAGHIGPLLNAIPILHLIEWLASEGQVRLLRKTVSALGKEKRRGQPSVGSKATLALAAAGVAPPHFTDLIKALEKTRDAPDENWLRAAVFALSSSDGKQAKDALIASFGPLHHAVTDDRLPRDLWTQLDKQLPKAKDPALRLRRLLLKEIRKGHWSEADVEAALRNGGPFIDQFLSEADEDLKKTVLKSWTPAK